MKRPDASIIRRALKGGRLVMGDTTKLGEVIKLGLDLPLMSFAGQDFKDTDIYAFGDTIFHGPADNGCYEPVFDEWVIHYDQSMTLETIANPNYEGVSPYNRRDRQEVDAQVWGCFLDPQHPFLKTLENYPETMEDHIRGFATARMDLLSTHRKPVIPETIKFVTLILEYRGEPLTYVWQGWTALTGDSHVVAIATEGAESAWEPDRRTYSMGNEQRDTLLLCLGLLQVWRQACGRSRACRAKEIGVQAQSPKPRPSMEHRRRATHLVLGQDADDPIRRSHRDRD